MQMKRTERRTARYEQIYYSMEPLRKAKKEAIHRLANVGKRYSVLRYPILAFLFVFLFIYNAIFYGFIHFRVHEKLARGLAMCLTVCLVINGAYLPSLAFSGGDEVVVDEVVEDIVVEEIVDNVVTDEVVDEVVEDVVVVEDEVVEDEVVEEEVVEDEAVEDEVVEDEVVEDEVVEDEVVEDEVVEDEVVEEEVVEDEIVEDEVVEDEVVEDEIVEEVVEEEITETPFSQSVVRGGVQIDVSAPAGVFPANAILNVKMITSQMQVQEIETMVAEKKAETTPDNVTTVVEQSYSFDITIVDENGMEIQPNTEKGQVSVVFKNVEAVAVAQEQTETELSVFHVTDDYSQVEEIATELDAAENSASITVDHFSIYTVVITTGIQTEDVIHQYYQGTSKANSYFTVYNEEQFLSYVKLLNGYLSGEVLNSDTVSAILVNADDSNPMDGITGLGQATNMTIRDLNFSVKLMDDITLTEEWSPIPMFLMGLTFDGGGHTLRFTSLKAGVIFDESNYGGLFVNSNGVLKDIVLQYQDQEIVIDGEEEEEYASVTVRVNGQKAEIGQAISGAEALAASWDGENYITLERSDDLSIYRTPLENLEEGKTYHVYYVYEDENETISAAELTTEDYTAELNYVSVTYDLEGANTYKLVNGELSENIMTAIRVDVLPDGSYEAQEDFETVVQAVAGYEIPTKETNVTICVNGVQLVRGTDYTYTYDSETKLGHIFISKAKIAGSVTVEVHADTLADKESATIILKTKGGSIADPLWKKDSGNAYTYTQTIYEGATLPTSVVPVNGSTSVKFTGWYTNIACTGTPVTEITSFTPGATYTYYAGYTIAKVEDNNGSMWYSYASGRMDVRGYNNGNLISTTYSNAGFIPSLYSGSLPSAGSSSADYSATGNITFNKTVGSNAFVNLTDNIYVAEVYSFDGAFINITYLFENRGTSNYTSTAYFGLGTDVQVHGDDSAKISIGTEGSAKYINMLASSNTAFRTYISGDQFGVDPVARYWYGYYGSGNYNGKSWSANVFNHDKDKNYSSGDSAMSFCWKVPTIQAGDTVTKNIKIGIGNASSLAKLTATFKAERAEFSSGKDSLTVTSSNKNISVLEDGRIKVDSTTYDVPTRTGYEFAYWSYTDGEFEDNPQPVKFTGAIEANSTLYAIWIPKPDRSVTNNCSVQKVDGSNNLLVPSTLANVVILNKTPGVDVAEIPQGQTVAESAGYASGFVGTIVLQGEDSRYLLPDDIDVTVTGDDGSVMKLTKDTGYTYTVYDNRRKADIEIRKQYINGDITITAVGYALPPVTATSVNVEVVQDTISYGERAVFTASAETSKNHVASYQWYVAPYYEIVLDNKTYWTYQNQDGVALQNGTYVCDALNSSGNPVTITGANKATLRISGLDVNSFSATSPGESMEGLRFGGYHLYCVVTSTRNITGQEIVAVSGATELQVIVSRYEAPTGIEGSATTYYGSSDGTISIEEMEDRPTLLYKKSTESQWKTVTEEQIEAGMIAGLSAGSYQFKYKGNTNRTESEVITTEVANGRYIVVTYRAQGCDDEDLRTQYKHVAYGTNVTAQTTGLGAQDTTIQSPVRTGYTFAGWDQETISGITEDTVVNAVYEGRVYKITLDNEGATTPGTTAIYAKYSTGFYLEQSCNNVVNGANGITIPEKEGYNFLGYFTAEEGGSRMIYADGCLSTGMQPTAYLNDATLYAHWAAKEVDFNGLPGINNPSEGPSTDEDVEYDIEPSEPGEEPGEDPVYDANTSYDVTVTNNSGKEANTIYIYSDGILKRTLTNVEFGNNNQYTFQLIPGEVGGGTITFAVGYVNPVKEDGETQKSEEELEQEANEQAGSLNYTIIYKEVNGSVTGTSFSGTFLITAPDKGVKGVATLLPEVTRTGYTFAGWYTTPRGTGRSITEIPATNTSNEVVVYAKWTANKYRVFFNTNGGSFNVDYEVLDQYQHGAENIVLPDETKISKANYAFLGWFDNENLVGEPVLEVDASMMGSVTYYAGWELLSAHSVTLPEEDDVYNVTGLAGYGFVSEGTIYVYDGQEYRFRVDVKPAFRLKTVKVNGKILGGAEGIYTIPAVTDDVVVTVITEQLVSTEDPVGTVEATILLTDGTTGYFETLEDAIAYAANYGTNSVIKLQQNIHNKDFSALDGRAYSIDMNGHLFTGAVNMLVEDGAQVTLLEVARRMVNENNALTVENRGELTNNTYLPEVLNLGILINNGKIANTLQQDSESYDMSKMINNGIVDVAVLEDGCFIENVLEDAPEGLTGYRTIMNENEYYVAFNDAVEIANQSEEDVTILILSTVDNRGSDILIANENGNKITVDLNGNDISGGTIETEGRVEFINGKGSANNTSGITSNINNRGDLIIDDNVKAGGTVNNEEEGNLTVNEGATVSGPVNNKGDFENNGNISGIVTNEGNASNNASGTMNNVLLKDGVFDNDGDISTKVEMEGGSYMPSAGAQPQVPEGAVAMGNTAPITYYGSLKDAIDDANDPEIAGAEGQAIPFEITILEDIADEDLGEAPLVLDPESSTNINLNNHQIGSEGSDDLLQIGGTNGNQTQITNNPVNGEAADPNKGVVNSPVEIEEGGSLILGSDTVVEDIENNGELEVEENANVNDLMNNGTANNNGTIDKLTQTGGEITNGEDGVISDASQTGGNMVNDGIINEFTQNGGHTHNNGTIDVADINKGGYSGEIPNEVNGEVSDDETLGKVALITNPGEDPVYFITLQDAMDYAAGLDRSPVEIDLIRDISAEELNILSSKQPANDIILDLNGFTIASDSSIVVEEGSSFTIKDSAPSGSQGAVEAPIVNKGTFTNETNIVGPVENTGNFNNKGNVQGTVSQKGGTYVNENGATTNDIIQTGGETINNDNAGVAPGGITDIDLQKGSYLGDAPTNGVDGEAKIGDRIYGDLKSAVEDANNADEDVVIELLDDVTLPDDFTLELDNGNGKDITLDLRGNDISGGNIAIGNENGDPTGNVVIKDSSASGEEQGAVSSDIHVREDADLELDDITVKAPGGVNNNGNLVNGGDIESTVNQEGGSFTNTEEGTVGNLVQNGGMVDNQNPASDSIGSAEINGGEYNGTPAEDMDYEGAKVAIISTNPDGSSSTTYYPTLEDALSQAKDGDVIKLLDDIKGETAEDIVMNKEGIILDLNGHEIGAQSTIEINEDAEVEITDSSANQSGKISSVVNNNGKLLVDDNTSVEEVTNNGTLVNEGTISKLNQESGSVKNENSGNIGEVEFESGSYEGKEPNTQMDSAAAQIGDKLYADLESAIEDANNANEDVEIEVLEDITIPPTEIGNENGHKITLNLGGNTVTGGPLDVVAPGKVELTDDEGDGSLQSDVNVKENSQLKVDDSATLEGDLNNEGNTLLEGTLVGGVDNSGIMENKGDIIGDVTNEEEGNFANAGENSYISGGVNNKGNVTNEGVVGGEVENTGAFENIGNVDNNVTNKGNGSFNNTGNVNGQLENKDNASTENSGEINQIKQTGGEVTNNDGGKINDYFQTGGTLENEEDGSIKDLIQTGGHTENKGEISDAVVSVPENFGGNLPENGLDNVEIVIRYTDENGETKVGYGETIEDALEAAEDLTKPVLIIPAKNPVVVDGDLTIPEGVILEIPADYELIVGPTGSITNNGRIDLNENAQLTIENGGALENLGKVENEGSITNNGSLTNNGQFENSGSVNQITQERGKLTNTPDGLIDTLDQTGGETENHGTIEDLTQTGGRTENEGSIDDVNISDVRDFVGNAPTNGLPGAEVTVKHRDENGDEVTEYYPSFEDAVEDAANMDGSVVIIPAKDPVVVDGDLTIPEDVILEIPADYELIVGPTGSITNNGRIDLNENAQLTIENGGALENLGKVENEGSITNNGSLTNNGQFENSGSVNQITQESGKLTNTPDGLIDTLEQTGGETENHGTIEDLTQTGGKTDNSGEITEGNVTNPDMFEGQLPESGMDNIRGSVTYEDENGKEVIKHFNSIEEALEMAEQKANATGETVVVTPSDNPFLAVTNMVIPENIILQIPTGSRMIVEDGTALEVYGDVQVEQGSELEVKMGAIVKNNGTIDNKGNLVNNGQIINTGNVINKDAGNITNNSILYNSGGSIAGTPGAAGIITNKGNIYGGEVSGPLVNEVSGLILGSSKIEGTIENNGKIEISRGADTSEADIINNPGSKYIIKVPTPPATENPKADESIIDSEEVLENADNAETKADEEVMKDSEEDNDDSEEGYSENNTEADAEKDTHENTEADGDNFDKENSETSDNIEASGDSDDFDDVDNVDDLEADRNFRWIIPLGVMISLFIIFIIWKRRKEQEEEKNNNL